MEHNKKGNLCVTITRIKRYKGVHHRKRRAKGKHRRLKEKTIILDLVSKYDLGLRLLQKDIDEKPSEVQRARVSVRHSGTKKKGGGKRAKEWQVK